MGDINNHVEKLKTLLKKIKYPNINTISEISENNPAHILHMIHYTLIDYNTEFYKSLLAKNYELFSKNDLRFIEQVYKLLIKEFNYKPSITISQFLSETFLEHKIIFVNDVIQLVQQKIPPTNIRKSSQKKIIKEEQQQPMVVRNIEDKENCSINQIDDLEDLPQKASIPQPMKQNDIQMEKQWNGKQTQEFQQPLSQQPFQQQVIPQQYTQQIQQPQTPYNQSQQFSQQQMFVQHPQPQFQSQPQHPQQLQSQPQQQPLQQSLYQPQPQQQQPPWSQSQPQDTQYVTQQDLNKVLQIVAVSNQNIQVVMKKFEDFQMQVGQCLTGLNTRILMMEQQFQFQQQ